VSNPTAADACCSLGFGSDLFTGSGSEANVFGCGILISPTQILTAMHVMPTPASDPYTTLPQDHSTTARVVRFRRKTDGTAPVDGTCAGSHQVYISGYRGSNLGADVALCDLATPVTHITPIEIDTGTPAVSDTTKLWGWGLDGSTLYSGSRPNDVREIAGKTIASVTTGSAGLATALTWSGPNPGPNLYDSGGACLRDVGGGVYRLTGIITGDAGGIPLDQFRHDASLPIPGLYSPGTTPANPASWFFSNDTSIADNTPTLDNSAATTILVELVTGKGAHESRVVFAGFNLSSITAVLGVSLVLTNAQAIPIAAGTTLKFSRIRRTGVTHLANWNTYDGTNNWGTAGAKNTSTDIYTTNQFTYVMSELAVGASVTIEHASLLAMAQAAKAEDGILRLLIDKDDTVGSANFWSNDALLPGYRPRLVVTTPSGIALAAQAWDRSRMMRKKRQLQHNRNMAA
jgi:hypothetical protein